MAVLGGDQKHKLGGGDHSRQQLAAGQPGNPDVNYEKRNRHYSLEEHMETFSSNSSSNSYFVANWQASSPSSTEQMLGHGDKQRNGSSQSPFRSAVSSREGSSRRFTVPFVKKIDWGSLWDKSKEWIRNPMNMALFIWIVAVGVSGAILFMVMTGMLNRVLPRKSQRDTWFEVNNQILNALFTLMCLYQHPRRFYHLALLCRWRAGDMLQLRQTYCKDGTCKPDERMHMMVVILLLHLNCFAQYALCGLNLGYPRWKRPPIGVGLTISVAICAPAVAGLYNNLSPLGKDYEAQPQADEESQSNPNPQLQRKALGRRCSFQPGERGEGEGGERNPQWIGGLFDLWDDISLAYLSVLCSCCVFGWNMSRLGLGNMYVHIVTFILFCLAPFFIFNLAAINIDNEAVRDALGLGGIFLCVLGLLYGGFWRIQMRRRFNLPANDACCGKPDLTDCLQWLCCYSCSLAQEVRTGDAYEVVQDGLYRRRDADGDSPSSSHSQMHHHPTLQDELSTMQQPLRFAGVFAPPLPAAAAAARSVNDGVTVPPLASVIYRD
ncbi:uncharacterized protein LOC133906546 [Phragmites australis]|uniref:uncharacterized protein LOC133906546 n=1 Tax=Phragmites australis TaxID=29695 RepID=UPI002D76522A|nr:uncharacterized protein LOC133906546 [Phragmites australis]XP_062204471.1 uncharacterized protein LOC133906546 [Phragmites australis]